MKFFIDSANIDEIKQANDWGVVDGVTTNPSLIAKEGRDFKQTVLEICEIVDGPISAEVVSLKSDEMIKEAKELAQWHKNIIIKVPCIPEGLKAVKQLELEGIKTNLTLVFSANQFLAGCKAGASYISPFVGRLDDVGDDGLQMISDCMDIVRNYGYKSEIIVASVRSPITVQQVAVLGAHVSTIPFGIMQKMLRHPLTDNGVEKFLKDWESVPK